MLVQSHLLYVGQACSPGRIYDVFVDVHGDALYYHRLMIFFFFAFSHSLLMMMIDKTRMMPLKASMPTTRT
jgi:hypothetical protein